MALKVGKTVLGIIITEMKTWPIDESCCNDTNAGLKVTAHRFLDGPGAWGQGVMGTLEYTTEGIRSKCRTNRFLTQILGTLTKLSFSSIEISRCRLLVSFKLNWEFFQNPGCSTVTVICRKLHKKIFLFVHLNYVLLKQQTTAVIKHRVFPQHPHHRRATTVAWFFCLCSSLQLSLLQWI